MNNNNSNQNDLSSEKCENLSKPIPIVIKVMPIVSWGLVVLILVLGFWFYLAGSMLAVLSQKK